MNSRIMYIEDKSGGLSGPAHRPPDRANGSNPFGHAERHGERWCSHPGRAGEEFAQRDETFGESRRAIVEQQAGFIGG